MSDFNDIIKNMTALGTLLGSMTVSMYLGWKVFVGKLGTGKTANINGIEGMINRLRDDLTRDLQDHNSTISSRLDRLETQLDARIGRIENRLFDSGRFRS